MISQIISLRDHWRAQEGAVVFARHGHTGDSDRGMFDKFFNDYIKKDSHGAQIVESLQPHPSDWIIDKNSYDAFLNTHLESHLKQINIHQVLVCGVLTHMCVESTARAAFCRGFEVYVPVDGVAANNEQNHINALGAMAQTVATVQTVESIIHP